MSLTNQMIQPMTEKNYVTLDMSQFTYDRNDPLFFETIALKKFESRLLDLSSLSLKKINDFYDQFKKFNKYINFIQSINEKTKETKNKIEEIKIKLREIDKGIKTRKIHYIIENNNPLLSQKIHLWLENYILFGHPKNHEYEYKKDILKTDNSEIQNTIIDLLEKISIFPTEIQFDALELSQQTPYDLLKIAKIFTKTAADKRVVLKSILKEHSSILRLRKKKNLLIQGIITYYNHITQIQIQKNIRQNSKDILKDLITIKGAKNVGLFGNKIDKLVSTESTAFFLLIFIKNQGDNFCYFCDYPLNVVYEYLTQYQLLDFYSERAYRFTSPLFYKCLIEKPKEIVILLNKYPEASNELFQQIIDELMTSEEKYIKFIHAKYPFTFINELHEKLKKNPEMVPLILGYIDQQQHVDKNKIMEDIWSFIHLHQVINIQDVLLIIKNIENFKNLPRELIKKGEYWALRKLVKLNGNKQENFIEHLLNHTCKKVDIINQKNYFSSKHYSHEQIKELIQKYISNGIGDDDIEIFCIRIANYIMPCQKYIDFEKIKQIISYSNFNSFPISPTIKNEIISTLKILISNRRICTQICEFQQLPEPESPMGRLLREMTGKDNPSVHDMQLTILSALLCPNRQENVNSCFSTSIIIQQKQYPEGIEQTLLDFIQMFKTNHLSFPITNKKFELSEPASYPVLVNSLVYHHNTKEHLLNRAREFTLASFGNNIIQEDNPVFYEFIILLLKIDINEIYYDKSISLFKLELENNIQWVYISSKKDPISKGFGAWNLRNKITNKMISSFDGWAELFNYLAIKVENQLKLEFPDKEENISFLFNGPNGLFRKINSQEFFSKFIKNSRHLTNFNSPWIKYDGGSTECLLESYFNSPDTEMTYKISKKRGERFFKLIINYLINLPPPIKKRVKKYPEFRIPMDYSFNTLDNIEGHSLSLKPTETLTLLDEYKTEKNILNKIKLLSNEFSCKKTNKHLIRTIINNMNSKLVDKNSFDPLSYLLSIPELYEEESIRNLWNTIMENSIKIGLELSNSLQLLMIKEIYHYSLLQESPKIIIGDTNYKILSEFILLPDPRKWGSWIPAYTTPNFDKIRFPDISAIHFHKVVYRDQFNLMS